MSGSLNRAMLIGHVGARPELRTNAAGVRVATFSLATGRPRSAGAESVTEWHRIVAWDALAVLIERRVDKGARLYVEGRVEYRSWTDRTGRSRTATEIIAEDVMLFESRARGAARSP
jgi:single-strand DNA-binding protein